MTWWSPVVVVACACGRLGFDPIGDGSGDGSVAPAGCTSPGSGDTFDGTGPCGSWGTPMAMNASVTTSNGALRIALAPGTFGMGACLRMAVPFGSAGFLIEVSQIAQGMGSLTAISLQGATNTLQVQAFMGTLVGTVESSNVGQVAYQPTAMRFWRARPIRDGVVFETSPDAAAWATFATSARPTEPVYDVMIGAFSTASTAAPGTAVFESVNTCP